MCKIYLKIVGKLSNKINLMVDSVVKQKANVKKAKDVFKSSYGAKAKHILQLPAKTEDATAKFFVINLFFHY